MWSQWQASDVTADTGGTCRRVARRVPPPTLDTCAVFGADFSSDREESAWWWRSATLRPTDLQVEVSAENW